MNVEPIRVTLKQHAKILLALLPVHVVQDILEMVLSVRVRKSQKQLMNLYNIILSFVLKYYIKI